MVYVPLTQESLFSQTIFIAQLLWLRQPQNASCIIPTSERRLVVLQLAQMVHMETPNAIRRARSHEDIRGVAGPLEVQERVSGLRTVYLHCPF